MKSNLLIMDDTDGFSKEQLFKIRDILEELIPSDNNSFPRKRNWRVLQIKYLPDRKKETEYL